MFTGDCGVVTFTKRIVGAIATLDAAAALNPLPLSKSDKFAAKRTLLGSKTSSSLSNSYLFFSSSTARLTARLIPEGWKSKPEAP